jgi:hypothetical protein
MCKESQAGIWHIDNSSDGFGFIATCWDCGHGEEVSEANAKLLVQAVNDREQLIAALRIALDHISDVYAEKLKPTIYADGVLGMLRGVLDEVDRG